MLLFEQRGLCVVSHCELHRRAVRADELNSFMFQSVGHEVIDAYAECMDVPVSRRTLLGSSKCTTLDYSLVDAADEVEDLYNLIQSVLVQQNPPKQDYVASWHLARSPSNCSNNCLMFKQLPVAPFFPAISDCVSNTCMSVFRVCNCFH